jgi:hypothetical protein
MWWLGWRGKDGEDCDVARAVSSSMGLAEDLKITNLKNEPSACGCVAPGCWWMRDSLALKLILGCGGHCRLGGCGRNGSGRVARNDLAVSNAAFPIAHALPFIQFCKWRPRRCGNVLFQGVSHIRFSLPVFSSLMGIPGNKMQQRIAVFPKNVVYNTPGNMAAVFMATAMAFVFKPALAGRRLRPRLGASPVYFVAPDGRRFHWNPRRRPGGTSLPFATNQTGTAYGDDTSLHTKQQHSLRHAVGVMRNRRKRREDARPGGTNL